MSLEVDFVMPVYHESENLRQVMASLAAVPISHRVLVIYDEDDDPTVPVAEELAGAHPELVLLKNRSATGGVLNAIRTGISAATAPVVIVTMADLSDDLAVVPEMVRLIRDESYDIVCASRYMKGGAQLGGPRLKGLLSRTAGLSLHLITGLPTHDATNAFRAYRREVLETIEIESEGGFEYTLELTVKAHERGYRITEVPSVWRDRSAGNSRFNLRKWLPQYLRWYGYALSRNRRTS
ncbi:MAG: glycosyltransferase [Deltaproteobacteria bacterium]|nr:glycosyltransferase [Deltaproteobacteria bacterium]